MYTYEWNWTYRIEHWVRVIAMALLIITGFYIHWPYLKGSPEGYLMAWMRFTHFISAYLLILGLIFRVYLSFFSRFYPDWMEIGPTWKNIKNSPDMLAYYLFLKDTHGDYPRYNPLQALTYSFWGFLIILQTITGFALYDGKVFGIFSASASFGWVNGLLGGETMTRLWHFAIMWVFIITIAVHIYMAILKTLTDRDHTFRSIFTGYKLKRTS
ncbi:MAG: Ni/Fe-hydrogenase, b-type cytochrome subunit [Deltaproteobacteria bacterium]|nr:Ni/Fe-hydrogenase, b-type cytochrome subunit [Deltaproteobacteria bacterium]